MSEAKPVTFEEYWGKVFTPTYLPNNFDSVMKNIAQNAWDFAIHTMQVDPVVDHLVLDNFEVTKEGWHPNFTHPMVEGVYLVSGGDTYGFSAWKEGEWKVVISSTMGSTWERIPEPTTEQIMDYTFSMTKPANIQNFQWRDTKVT